MHDDLRLFHSFDFKKTKKLLFSSGGHLLCAANDKQIVIYSTYGLEELVKFDSSSQAVTSLAFNHTDSVLSFTSADGFHQRYDVVGLKRRGEAFIDRSIEYRDVVYLQDPYDDTRCVTVGMEAKSSGIVRIFSGGRDKEDRIEQEESLNDPKTKGALRLNGATCIQTYGNNLKCMAAVTNKGSLRVVPLNDKAECLLDSTQPHQSIYAHLGESKLVCNSVDGKYVFTAGVDG
jgi:WD40 repeat protein